MGQNYDGIGDEIKKLAEIVEILDNSFFRSNETEVTISLDENKFQLILKYLNHKTTDKKCIVSIGNTNFTFLQK
jgi:hypothetical protein